MIIIDPDQIEIGDPVLVKRQNEYMRLTIVDDKEGDSIATDFGIFKIKPEPICVCKPGLKVILPSKFKPRTKYLLDIKSHNQLHICNYIKTNDRFCFTFKNGSPFTLRMDADFIAYEIEPDKICPECKGKGAIMLFTSIIPCSCKE